MSEAIEQLLRLIPVNDISNEQLNINEILEAFATVDQLSNTDLCSAITQVLLRTIETFLLADHRLLEISRYPSAYLGKADKIITERIEFILGVSPPKPLVNHIRKCLTGHIALNGNKGTISAQHVKSLFADVAKKHPRKEVRCSICGYHFQEKDVGSDRLAWAKSLGINFASSYDPGRLNDDLKSKAFSRLEVDHVVPEQGLGWTELDNFQFACQFCNNGRLIFRRPLEAVSTMIAGAMCAFPPTRPHQITRQVIMVSAIGNANYRCSTCGIDKSDAELTAQVKSGIDDNRMWFVPWNLEVTCYRCSVL